MASDTPGDTSVSVDLPESLRQWLDDKAREEGHTREDVLLQLLSAYRKVDGLEGGDVELPGSMAVEGLDQLPAALREEFEARVDEHVEACLDERVDERVDQHVDERVERHLEEHRDDLAPTGGAVTADELDDRLDALESQFERLLGDVRERVVQVKRESDAKAPADHDHPHLAERVDDVEALGGTVDTLETDLEDLRARLDAGFDNYEQVLEYLADTLDHVSGRQTTLARALVETRTELRKLAARDAARSAVEDLQLAASQLGIRTATCEQCDTTVDVAVLPRAECPHCSTTFTDLETASGFFGSNTLVAGDQPALEAGDADGGPDDGFEFGVTEIIESDDAVAPDLAVDDGDGDDG